MKFWTKLKSSSDKSSPQAKIFFIDFGAIVHIQLMKFWTKLKSSIDKSSPQAKIFFTDFGAITRIQLMTFWTKSKSRIDESSPQAKFFLQTLSQSHDTINENLNEIESQDWWKLAAGEKISHFVFWFSELWTPVGGVFWFSGLGGVAKFTGCDLPPSGGRSGNIPGSRWFN